MKTDSYCSRILLLGAAGQVGQAWQRVAKPGQVVAAMDRQVLDLSQTELLAERLEQAIETFEPTAIVNAAAYTAVDQAEDNEAAAYAINALAPGIMATIAASHKLPLVHYSTDYVFDGHGESPFAETDPPNPLSVYGRSKLAGERAVQAAAGPHLILRTSWVFGAQGQNFLKTMLRLAQTRDELRVVNDQIGAPTSAELLATLPLTLLSKLSGHSDARWGLYHACPEGYTSWHAYACYVIGRARASGWPIRLADDAIIGIPSREFPVKATRPHNSRLSTDKLKNAFDLSLPTWQSGVDRVLAALEISE